MALATLSGLAQENMNRVAGWRFLDIGPPRRARRSTPAASCAAWPDEDATQDDLDLLLDLVDSQITYRSRYLVGMAMNPVRDLVMLDPFNPRSLAFQVEALKGTWPPCRPCRTTACPRSRRACSSVLQGQIETEDAASLDSEVALVFEQMLMGLSNAIADALLPARIEGRPDQEARRSGVIYGVRHLTTYSYENAGQLRPLRLAPVAHPGDGQTVLESAVTLTPKPARIEDHTGQFGERVMTATIETSHKELNIHGHLARARWTGRPCRGRWPAKPGRLCATRRSRPGSSTSPRRRTFSIRAR